MNQNSMSKASGLRIAKLWLSSDKAFHIILALVFLLLTVGYMVILGYDLARADKAMYTGTDGALYIILAEALSSGRGYRQVHLVSEPRANVQPVMPLILLPIVRFFGRNVPMMKLLITLMGLLSAWFLYILLRDLAGRKLALAIAFLYSINGYTIVYSGRLLTEMPYLLFSLLALVFMRRYFEGEQFSIRVAFLCTLFIWLSYFTRALGISLVAAFVAYFIIERILGKTDRGFWRVLLTLIVIAIPIGLWAYRCNMAQSFVKSASGGYGATVGAAGAVTNILRRVEAHISFYMAGKFLYVPLAPIALYGIGWCLLRKRTVMEYYAIIFMVMLALVTGPARKYTFDEMWAVKRYFVPMIPFILYYCVMGGKSILDALTSLDKRKLLGCLVFLLSVNLLVMLFYTGTGRGIRKFLVDYLSIIILCALITVLALISSRAKSSWPVSEYSPHANRVIAYTLLGLAILHGLGMAILYVTEISSPRTPAWDEYINIAEWVEENTPAESIVMCRKPRLFYYWTDRKVVVYPFSRDVNVVMNSVYRNSVDYVVVDSFQWTNSTDKYLLPALVGNKDKFSVAYRKGISLLLSVKTAGDRE